MSTAKVITRAASLFLAVVLLLAVFADVFFELPRSTGSSVASRNVLALSVHGARGSVVIGLSVALFAVTAGVIGGGLAGFGPRIADALLGRAVEITGALPTVVIVALVRAIDRDDSVVSFIGVLALLQAVHVARLVRGEVLRVRGQDFVLAAQALGAAPARVFRFHVLPHVLSPVLVRAALVVAAAVALEAALGFLGLAPAMSPPSWGVALSQATPNAGGGALLLPAFAAIATTMSLWVVADALDDSLSARRGRPKAW